MARLTNKGIRGIVNTLITIVRLSNGTIVVGRNFLRDRECYEKQQTCVNFPDSLGLDECLWTKIPQRSVHGLMAQPPLSDESMRLRKPLLLLLQSVDDA